MAIVRDIAIIILAIQSIIIMALLAILVWQVWRLVKLIQTEVKPIIRDAQETASTVRGTTSFMSENLVSPVVDANRKAAGVTRTLQVLAADLPLRRKRKTE